MNAPLVSCPFPVITFGWVQEINPHFKYFPVVNQSQLSISPSSVDQFKNDSFGIYHQLIAKIVEERNKEWQE